MKCKNVIKRMTAYLDSEIHNWQLNKDITSHISYCDKCALKFEEHRNIKQDIKSLDRIPVNKRLTQSIMSSIHDSGEIMKNSLSAFQLMIKNKLAPAMAVMIIFVSIMGSILSLYQLGQTVLTEVDIIDLLYI